MSSTCPNLKAKEKMILSFVNYSFPLSTRFNSINVPQKTTVTKRAINNNTYRRRSVIASSGCDPTPSIPSNSSNSNTDKQEEYRHFELLDDEEASADMTVWNTVIHASLKRKLQGLISESQITNGVSALLHTSPATQHTPSSSPSPSASTTLTPTVRDADINKSPAQVISYLLSSFKQDALVGACAFVQVASDSCHVKHTNPETLVLFIGDNENYRPLLRLTSFCIENPRFEHSHLNCVVTVVIHLPNVGENETAKFDFQLSTDNVNGNWFVDEVFSL